MRLSAEIAVVGSGFAGSILSRVLARQGWRVVLLDRARHPRFALGESTTPLANLCLERLAQRWGLDDLADLAAHGRWLAALPELRRGLKRGFSFYCHRPGRPFRDRADNPDRLLVAASPEDALADSHWLRADVDAHLAARAAAEGVEVVEEAELATAERTAGGWRLGGSRRGRRLEVAARLVVDGTGPGGFLARALPIGHAPPRRAGPPWSTGFVAAHLEGVAPLAAALGRADPAPGDPYPEERAAVHHLLDEGWVWSLAFDHGVVSVGAVLRAGGGDGEDPRRTWERLLARYPALERQYGGARAVVPFFRGRRTAHRRAAAAGPDWALLPHAYAFLDPLFSTGIAWSLLGVERLAAILERRAGAGPPELGAAAGGLAEDLAAYARLLAAEADRVEALLAAAWTAMGEMELFAAVASWYFVVVSHAEASARLLDPGESRREPAWEGFLAVRDPRPGAVLGEIGRGLRALVSHPGEEIDRDAALGLTARVREALEPWNVAGLADPARRNLYPVDLAELVRCAPRLGLAPEEIERRLPRLRGAAGARRPDGAPR